MFLASCCKRYCGGKSVENGNVVLPDLKDLVLKPEAINSTLDEKINNWQSALNELKDVERDLLDKYPELLPVLNEIKSSPWMYQQNVNETYSFFSSLVIRVIECERLLPQQSDEESVRSKRTQSTSSSVMDWSGESPLLESPKTVGVMGKLSSIWSKRLNGMNQTQGALVITTDPEIQNLRLKPNCPIFVQNGLQLNTVECKNPCTISTIQEWPVTPNSGQYEWQWRSTTMARLLCKTFCTHSPNKLLGVGNANNFCG